MKQHRKRERESTHKKDIMRGLMGTSFIMVMIVFKHGTAGHINTERRERERERERVGS